MCYVTYLPASRKREHHEPLRRTAEKPWCCGRHGSSCHHNTSAGGQLMPDAFQKHSAFLTLHAKRKKVLIFLLFDFHIFLLDDTTNIDKVKKFRYNDNIMEWKAAYFLYTPPRSRCALCLERSGAWTYVQHSKPSRTQTSGCSERIHALGTSCESRLCTQQKKRRESVSCI